MCVKFRLKTLNTLRDTAPGGRTWEGLMYAHTGWADGQRKPNTPPPLAGV